jgi:hypothetical protein
MPASEKQQWKYSTIEAGEMVWVFLKLDSGSQCVLKALRQQQELQLSFLRAPACSENG